MREHDILLIEWHDKNKIADELGQATYAVDNKREYDHSVRTLLGRIHSLQFGQNRLSYFLIVTVMTMLIWLLMLT